MTTRAAIYARISTSGQEDGTSLDTQVDNCRRYCEENGYEIVAVERDVHSGADLHNRPGLNRLRGKAKDGQIQVIVVWDLDRLTRSQSHVGVLIDDADRYDYRLETVREPIDQTPTGILLTQVRTFSAEIEREKIRERSMRGKLRRIEEGQIPAGSTDLFGYRTDRENNVRVIRDDEALNVREIYERVMVGESLISIVRWLNESNIDSPAKRRGTVYKDGRVPGWSARTVGNIVRHPAYRGVTVAFREARRKNRTSPRGTNYIKPESEWMILDMSGTTTPAIIDPTRWEQANERLSANKGSYSRSLQGKYPILTRGRVYCGGCTRAMYIQAGGNFRYPRFRCTHAYGSQKAYRIDITLCPSKPSMRTEDLDAQVWSAISDVLRNRETVLAEIKKRLDNPNRMTATAERNRLESDIAKADSRKGRLIDLYTRESITEREFDEKRAEIDAELDRLQKSLEGVEAQIGKARGELIRLDALDDIAQLWGDDPDATDFETRLRIITELGVRAVVTGYGPMMTWELPLPTGIDSGTRMWIDWNAVPEPTPEQVEEAAEFSMRENAWREEPERIAALPPPGRR